MKTISLFFEVNQPLKLKKYHFFNIGKDSFYLDEYLNKSSIVKAATKCYIPTNKIISKLIDKHKDKFKLSFSISGLAIEQLKLFAPNVLDSFKELVATGNVELLAETYSHSIASIKCEEEFIDQIKLHAELIEKEFGVKPVTFRNTEMIYTDEIGKCVCDLGYETIITEGAKHILGWKSPNYLYANALEPKQKILMRNSSLSDDLTFRFGDKTWDQWPLTGDKYASWVKNGEGDVTNIFLNYDLFGEKYDCNTGVFEFLEGFVNASIDKFAMEFSMPKEIVKLYQPISAISVLHPISWADEEKNVTPWIGNELQREALDKLFSVRDKLKELNNKDFYYVWNFLQSSNHFYYMSTRWFGDSNYSKVSPYDSPYEAFINYMNIVSNFMIDIDNQYSQRCVI